MILPVWYRIVARVRGVTAVAFLPLIVVGVVSGATFVTLAGFVCLVIALGTTMMPGAPAIAPMPVEPPVRGRWVALNSPATKRPSHGTNGLGQTFAIDLVHEPEPGGRPAFATGPGFRAPSEFPAFGSPIYAPADGTVVRVREGARDHRSRISWPAYLYLIVEGMLREAAGPRFLLGNHVVIDIGNGVYAVLAHLRKGSVTVEPGRRVTEGQEIAACGNSGNSSEPHIHFQLMDARQPLIAAGLPFQFPGGVPGNSEALIA